MFLYDITMIKDGEQIYQNIQNEAYREYLKYRNSDSRKSEDAKRKYQKFGGSECLGCGLGETFIGPKE
jgi:hypothetical protein